MKIIENKLFVLLTALALTFTLGACTVEKTEEGELPEVDVQAEEGELPEYDVEGADVEIRGEEKTVTVPDVDVTMEEKEITVPEVDIEPPGADDDDDGDGT